MHVSLVNTVSFMLVINMVVIVANESENKTVNESKDNSILDQIFSEGGSSNTNHSDEPKKRIVGRKGVEMDNSTLAFINDINKPNNSESEVHARTDLSKSSKESSSVLNSSISTQLMPSITNLTSNVTTEMHMKASISSTTINNTLSSSTTTTTTTTTTTKKPIRKPEITFSADDNADILQSEKNIKYIESIVPKVEPDRDRSVLEEKREHRNYAVYLGFFLAFPLAFLVINITYRKIKNYLEIRHYQRVDFLVDGMYVS
jgi:hypothetical protein